MPIQRGRAILELPRFDRIGVRGSGIQKAVGRANLTLMSGQGEPITTRIDHARDGAVVVFTPCHEVRVWVPPDQAEPGVVLHPVCPRCGQAWLLELIAGGDPEAGLRPTWTNPGTDGI